MIQLLALIVTSIALSVVAITASKFIGKPQAEDQAASFEESDRPIKKKRSARRPASLPKIAKQTPVHQQAPSVSPMPSPLPESLPEADTNELVPEAIQDDTPQVAQQSFDAGESDDESHRRESDDTNDSDSDSHKARKEGRTVSSQNTSSPSHTFSNTPYNSNKPLPVPLPTPAETSSGDTGDSIPPEFNISSIAVVNNALVIRGTNLENITDLRIAGPSVSSHLTKVSTTTSEIRALALSGLSLARGIVYNLLISNAYATTTYPVEVELEDGSVPLSKLEPLSPAEDGYVIKWDGVNEEWTVGAGAVGGTTLDLTSDVGIKSLGIGTNTPNSKLGIVGTFSEDDDDEYVMKFLPTINQTGTAGYTGIFMNVTETSTGSGDKKLMDLQVNGASKFSIDNTGSVTANVSMSGTTANYTSIVGPQLSVGFDNDHMTTIDVDNIGFTTFTSNGLGAGYSFIGGKVGIGTGTPGSSLDVVGATQTGASATGTLKLAQTWNTTGAPSAIRLDVTDTASHASSLLMDLRVGGTSKFNVTKGTASGVTLNLGSTGGNFAITTNGNLGTLGGNHDIAYNGIYTGRTIGGGGNLKLRVRGEAAQTANLQEWQNSGGTPLVLVGAAGNVRLGTAPAATANYGTLSVGNGPFDGTTAGFFAGSANGTHIAVNAASGSTANLIDLQVAGSSKFTVNSSGQIGGRFSVTNSALIHANNNSYLQLGGTQLYEDGASHQLALRNGANAQTFRIANTYTSSTDYERAKLEWSGNTFNIGTEKGSAGGTARDLALQTDGTTRMSILSSGNVGIGTTNPGSKLDVYLNPANTYTTEKVNIGPGIIFGNYGSSYSGFWLTSTSAPVAPSATNYTMISDGTGAIFNAPTGGNLNFSIANSSKMYLNSSGYFGIGTTSPTNKLHLSSNTAAANVDLILLDNPATQAIGNAASILFFKSPTLRVKP